MTNTNVELNELQSFGRKLLVLPPLLLLGAGIGMLAVAYFAWGAAASIDWPAWIPTASAVVFGVPSALLGAASIRDIWHQTARGYKVNGFMLAVAFPVFLIATAAVVMLALRVADSATYENLRDSQGKVVVPAWSFVFISVVATMIATGIFAAFTYYYRQAISVDSPSRFDRTADEVDVMGLMLKQMNDGSGSRGVKAS